MSHHAHGNGPDLSSVLGAASALSASAKMQLLQQLQEQLGMPAAAAAAPNAAAAPISNVIPPTHDASSKRKQQHNTMPGLHSHSSKHGEPEHLSPSMAPFAAAADTPVSPPSSSFLAGAGEMMSLRSPTSRSIGSSNHFLSLHRLPSSLTSSLDSQAHLGSPSDNNSLVSTMTSTTGGGGGGGMSGWRSASSTMKRGSAGMGHSAHALADLCNSAGSMSLHDTSNNSRTVSQRHSRRGSHSAAADDESDDDAVDESDVRFGLQDSMPASVVRAAMADARLLAHSVPGSPEPAPRGRREAKEDAEARFLAAPQGRTSLGSSSSSAGASPVVSRPSSRLGASARQAARRASLELDASVAASAAAAAAGASDATVDALPSMPTQAPGGAPISSRMHSEDPASSPAAAAAAAPSRRNSSLSHPSPARLGEYILGEPLGSGPKSATGRVHRATDKVTGAEVAIKVYVFPASSSSSSLSSSSSSGGSMGSSSGGGGSGGKDEFSHCDPREAVRREVTQWSTLISAHHSATPNLLPVYGALLQGSSQLWVVSQLQEWGSLSDLLAARRKSGKLPAGPHVPAPPGENFMPERLVGAVVRSACLGLQQLYACYSSSSSVAAGQHPPGHGSLSLSSLLLSASGTVRLSPRAGQERLDATFRPGGIMSNVYRMSPESITSPSPAPRLSDIWQIGILAIELLEGAPPHAGLLPLKVCSLIPRGPAPTLRSSVGVREDMVDFVRVCCVKDPAQRATLDTLLLHPFITHAAEVSAQELVDFARASS